MKKKFITNLILLLILNLLIKPFWIFGIDRTVQNLVGAEEYGFYFSLFSLSVLLNIILDAGLTNFNNRAISRNPKLITSYFSNIVVIKFALAVIYFIISILMTWLLGYDKRQFALLMILCLNQFLSSFIMYLRSNVSGLQFYSLDSILSVLDRTIMIILCSVLLWTNFTKGVFQIEWFAWTQTLSYSITAAIIYFILIGKAGKLKLQFNFKYFNKILIVSLPFATLVFLMACYNRVDSVMLERMLPNGKHQAGIYAQAFRVLEALSMFGFLFAGLLLPMFSKMLKKKENVSSLVYLAFSLIIIPALIVAAIAFVYGNQLMQLLYHSSEAASIFGILMTGYIAIAASYIFGTLLTANGSLKALNIMAAFALVLNVVLNIFLIPRYGAMGSAIASASTQVATGITQIFLSFRLIPLKSDRVYFIRLLSLFLMVSLGSYLLFQLDLQWIKGSIILGSATLISAFILGLLSLRRMTELKSEFDFFKS